MHVVSVSCECSLLDIHLQADYEEQTLSLKVSLTNPNNDRNIAYLMKETFANRRAEMQKYQGRPMHKLCKRFPVLTHYKYVSCLPIFAVQFVSSFYPICM